MRFYTAIGVIALAGFAAPAFGGLTGPAVHVTASNAQGTGFFDVPQSLLTMNNGALGWTAQTPYPIMSSTGVLLGTLSSCSISYRGDPVVSLSFGVTANSSATTFTITSALLSFAAISPAVGTASAGVTITDVDGNGVTFTGLQPGAFAYRSQYNGLVPGGTDFASFISPLAAGPFGTNIANGSQPLTAIGVPVTSMSAQWNFTLSANDSAGGTSAFNIVPAPGAMALLGLGGLVAARRRR